jgi:hypothetical protein
MDPEVVQAVGDGDCRSRVLREFSPERVATRILVPWRVTQLNDHLSIPDTVGCAGDWKLITGSLPRGSGTHISVHARSGAGNEHLAGIRAGARQVE